jgi:hypothetical protein
MNATLTLTPSKTRATIDYLRACQRVRKAGHRVSFTTDPAWLVEQAINRRAGWVEDPHSRGSCLPIEAGRLHRKTRGDWQRHLRLLASSINTPRLIVRTCELGEHRWLVERLPDRFTDGRLA